MSGSLMIYSSKDGHTKKICETIIKSSKNAEHFEMISLENAYKLNLDSFDLIVIGASIRYGNYDSKLFSFINKNKDILRSKKSAFFSVNVVARKSEKNRPENNPYIKKFLKKSSWSPNLIDVFAGKVDYPSYNFFNKNIIKFIMFISNGPTNTSKTYEFTNWERVNIFTKDLNKLI